MSAADQPSDGKAPVTARAAALIGVLAMAAALGAGHLVAGILLVSSASPFLAVGNAAIDRTPGPVKDFAIEQFGSNDKLVLLIGMAIVITTIAIVAGLVARRRLWPGLVVVVALGVVGLLAVLEQTSGGWAVLAPIVSLLTAAACFAGLHTLAARRTAERSPTRAPGAWSGGDDVTGQASPRGGGDDVTERRRPRGTLERRGFLVAASGVAAGAALSGVGGFLLARRVDVEASRRAVGTLRPAMPAPPIPPGADFVAQGTPTFITPSADFYRVDINLTPPRLRAQDAVLRITGMVDQEIEFSFAEIRERPLVEKTITMTCVSNQVGGPYVSTANFIGVPLADLLAEAGVDEAANQLVGHSADGFTIGTPLSWVLDPRRDALLAIGMNGEPLLPEHGFPMRTVIAGLYGYVSATKWLTELELTTFDFDPYWERRGWDGDPEGIVAIKTQSRIDSPGSFERVPAGEVTFAGIAYAQTVGIAKVEIQLDDGPWQAAELGAEVNVNTWRMWRATRRLASGSHTVTVRATDKSGTTQTAERVSPINPGPDGATGRQSISFTAE